MDTIKRICLWSGPRNISTALMYSFAQREDTKVFDEPLYGFYLDKTKAKEYQPGAEEILGNMELNGNKVIDFTLSNNEKPVLFFKHMTKHLLDLDRSFLNNVVNVILTRDPKDMISSFSKVIKEPTEEDLGYKQHIELITYFEKENIEYVVLDSKKVLMNPRNVLNKLCDFIGIPFSENMLSWKAQKLQEDGSWAKYWYKNVHNSTKFGIYKEKNNVLPQRLQPLLSSSLELYKILEEKALC